MSHADPLSAIPQALRDALLDPERRDRSVVVDGAEVQVRYDPEPGVERRVHVAEGAEEMTMTSYEAVAERPASYPPELPFIPGLKVSLQGAGATWWTVPDVDYALAELRAQSTAAGWTESAAPNEMMFGMRSFDFVRADGRERSIHVTPFGKGSMIMLHDTRPR